MLDYVPIGSWQKLAPVSTVILLEIFLRVARNARQSGAEPVY